MESQTRILFYIFLGSILVSTISVFPQVEKRLTCNLTLVEWEQWEFIQGTDIWLKAKGDEA
jgi:hypothetical protein